MTPEQIAQEFISSMRIDLPFGARRRFEDELAALLRQVQAAERERAAQAAQDVEPRGNVSPWDVPDLIAARIRALD